MAIEQQDKQQVSNDATRSPGDLFRYSAWVHIGAGAEVCENRENGECTEEEHFHAWCRLPNQVQHQDIRERALASKARRIRQLRDPESDAHTVLEGDMDDLKRLVASDELIDELIGKDWWKRQLDAMNEVEDGDEQFKTIERDRERLQELREKPEGERPDVEYDELERHVAKYLAAVDAKRKEAEAPMRAALGELTLDELIAQIRDERVTTESHQAFMETYSQWEWLAGTFKSNKGPKRQRVFSNIDELEDSAPEVLEALQRTFGELEASLQRGPRGN
jgi:hypothetical protein